MDVTLITRQAPGAGPPDPRVYDSTAMPAAAGALGQLRATSPMPTWRPRPSCSGLPPQTEHGTAVVGGRGDPRFRPAHPDERLRQLRHGPDRARLRAAGEAGNRGFYRRVRERYPYPPSRRPELSARDVLRCATDGGEFAVERFGAEEAILERVEEFGALDLDRYDGADRLRRELPGLVLQLARLRFGTVGPTNHFIELQQVEEVFDPATAAKLGVAEGQVTLQYHAGGGVLTGEIGAMFGRRKHYPRDVRAAMSVIKPLYHMATARSLAQLRKRYALYFTGGCPPVNLDSDEGRRLMLANAAAMNYGFAFRIAVYTVLRRIATQTFGGSSGQLVVDSPHNSIYEEEVNGEPAVVHRHNSCRAYPAEMMPPETTFASTGQAVLVPGTHRTSSYLCVAGGSAAALYSACHGAGTVIADFARQGISQEDPWRRTTLRFRYDGSAPTDAGHLDDKGVDEVLGVLVRGGLVRPVARMRPFAVLH